MFLSELDIFRKKSIKNRLLFPKKCLILGSNNFSVMENFNKDILFDSQESYGLGWLYNRAKNYRSSEDFKKMMKFSAKFRTLAPYNAMLVYKQKPGARYVMGAEGWYNRYHRIIKPNAQNLVILNFKPCGFIFDISDTIPDPDYKGKKWGDQEILYDLVDKEKAFFTEEYRSNCMDNLFKNISKHGLAVDSSYNTGSTLYADIRLLDNPLLTKFNITKTKVVEYRLPYLISISKNSKDAEFITYLMHELAHFFLRHLRVPHNWNITNRIDNAWEQRVISKKAMEIEAESVAWLICNRIGINTNSYEYIAEYLEDDEELPQDIDVESIYRAANKINDMFDDVLDYKDCLLYKYDSKFRDYVSTLKSNYNK